MFDLGSFGLTDLLECTWAMRRLGASATSMESAAQEVVCFLYDRLIDKRTDEPALALVRLYKTHRFDELEVDLQAYVTERSDIALSPDTSCLTLMATAGAEPAWNDRRLSKDHRAIALHDAAAVESSPMVSALTKQLGFDEVVVRPDPALFQSLGTRPAGVFFVRDARGSPHVPAQDDFVVPYGIKSVIGFGAVLPSGYAFAVVMFATVDVPAETAEVFSSMAFAAELALLPFVEGRLFESDPEDTHVGIESELRRARAEATALGHLLDTRHNTVAEQAARLEQARRDAEDRAEALVRSQARLERSEAVKAAILDNALDCVITMDENGCVVDFNPAAERTFGYARSDAIGQSLAELIIPERYRDRHRAGLERYATTGTPNILGQRIEIEAIRADGSEFPVELTVSAVNAAGLRLFSGHVRDITERVRAEAELRASSERYREIARILQASLLPPALPTVPRLEVASAYHPGDEGMDVGGDFYDVFDLGSGRWGVVLGDVMGKGAEAAVTTATARHTVRAAAIAAAEPTAVLQMLNAALHRSDPDRFCTAVFAFVEVDGGVSVRAASGGHPRPLVRRGSEVAEAGTAGIVLGPFEEWHAPPADAFDLRAGDLVLLYSDGVVDARRDGEEFGLDRLRSTLAATEGATATETVAAITAAVEQFATMRSDDLTMLALRMA